MKRHYLKEQILTEKGLFKTGPKNGRRKFLLERTVETFQS